MKAIVCEKHHIIVNSFCDSSVFGSLVILDVVCRYLSLFVLYINIEIGKNRCEC